MPADFAAPPTARRLRAWEDADRAARPVRLGRLRARLSAAGVDAYFGLRREEIRYLTGVALGEGEEKVAGHSGRFLVSMDEVVVLADTRYTLQCRREAPGARVEAVTYDLPARWRELVTGIGARRIAVPADDISFGLYESLAAAAPEVELAPAGRWVDEARAVKEPAEVERIAAAAAVADRALAALLPIIRPGATERELAWRLEVLMREHGAEALAFDVAALAGAQAALPHGSPGDRRLRAGRVMLFDFGAQVAGYRSDMTRTLFVGEPAARDLAVYELVARAQAAAIDLVERSVADGTMPSGRAVDAAARQVIDAAGHGGHFGHGTGHGIGLATHEAPSLSRVAAEAPLPSPTVFSVEPGVYLGGRTGVRIEDLIHVDVEARSVERLTRFPREALVLPG
ncbi:MAG TPA: aminopeptidase P family protein [Candidatus Limnocylindrales bacterium]|nr:aminopeptidase P family protein [Candidatus Limnocylindrales bacterium]